MTLVRALVALAAVMVALVLQVTVFPHVAWEGIVPNLVLLVVVGAALTRGPQFAAVLGFAAGGALDLAPPADHTAGRWALALVLVGYVAGRVHQEQQFNQGRATSTTVIATVAVSSFVGTSVFALTGMLLEQPALDVTALLQVILVAVLWDVLLTPIVLPPLMGMFRRIEPDRVLIG